MPELLPFSPTLLRTWADYRQTAARSRALKAQIQFARQRVLFLMIAGASFGALVVTSESWSGVLVEIPSLPKVFAAISAFCLGLVAVFSQNVLRTENEKDGVLLRSIAEALKSEAFKFMAKAPPYNAEDADDKLADRAKQLYGGGLPGEPVSLDPERERQGLPETWLSVDDYVEKRVREQIDQFYKPRSLASARRVKQLRITSFALAVAGAAIAAMAALLPDASWTAAWTGAIGTATGAIAAHLFAERLQYLTISYDLTARRLEWLVVDWTRLRSRDEQAAANELILACEDAISVENSAWVAEWMNKTEAPEQPGTPSKQANAEERTT